MSSKSEKTRERILAATLDLLEAGGGRKVRVSDIATAAGISRQALYLHFRTRSELLIAATKYLDEMLGSEERLLASRTARTGLARLEAFVGAWTGYIPEIYGVAKALMAMAETDDAAAEAWNVRMRDMREGCEAAVRALAQDQYLGDIAEQEATDLLWTILSVRNWEQLVRVQGWSQRTYERHMLRLAQRLLCGS